MLPKNVIYYGKKEDLPEIISLRAGPLMLDYQNGEIGNIDYKNIEVVQRIYANVRDRNWGTVPNHIHAEKISRQEKYFEINFSAECIQKAIDFIWEGEIIGTPNGEIMLSFNGQARSDFQTCRIGFCILHPLKTCMAKTCRIINHLGQQQTGIFPISIAPAEIQPFIDIRSMEYEITPGVNVNLTFEGDLFEMEDQRNWMDASYKTFCTPLRMECPRKIKAGTKIFQKVTLKLITSKTVFLSTPKIQIEENVTINLDRNKTGNIPSIGLGSPSRNQDYSEEQIHRLKALNLSHLRLDFSNITLSNESFVRKRLQNAIKIGLPLELVLYLHNVESELRGLLKILEGIDCFVARWIIFEKGKYISTKESLIIARNLLKGKNKGLIGGGSDADFYEINSQRIPLEWLDFICYSLNPQVHRSDNSTLIENLETAAMIVECALQIASGKPIVISPITLKQRFNPVAMGPVAENKINEMPSNVDPRQSSLFAAGWTIGSMQNLLHSRASSLTYYETTGWQGIMENESGSLLPEKFHSIPGGVFPIYHVFADVGAFKDGKLFEATSSDPRRVVCLGMGNNEMEQLLFANLTPSIQMVTIRGMNKPVHLRLLDETNALDAMTNPEEYRLKIKDGFSSEPLIKIELKPFAIGRLNSK